MSCLRSMVPSILVVLAAILMCGDAPGTLAADVPGGDRPRLVIVIAEDEYETDKTLPAFAERHLAAFDVRLVLENEDNLHDLPDIAALDDADLALFSIRRRVLLKYQMEIVRRYLKAGKPLVAIRTTSHAFALREGEPLPEGCADWRQFDQEVLGCHYTGHHGNKSDDDGRTFVWAVPGAESHPIMTSMPTEEFQVGSWLYKSLPLADSATELLRGRVEERQPHEPVAWTNTTPWNGRVFYTSLGHVDDFELPGFVRLLLNGTYWAAGLDVPQTLPDPAEDSENRN